VEAVAQDVNGAFENITTAVREGLNSKIIKRRAGGFRNASNFKTGSLPS
jgi:transposase